MHKLSSFQSDASILAPRARSISQCDDPDSLRKLMRKNLMQRWKSLKPQFVHFDSLRLQSAEGSTTCASWSCLTENGVEVRSECYLELDFEDGSLWFPPHTHPPPRGPHGKTQSKREGRGGEERHATMVLEPRKGDLVCGFIEEEGEDRAFACWFYSSKQFLNLWHLVLDGERSIHFKDKAREQIIFELTTPGCCCGCRPQFQPACLSSAPRSVCLLHQPEMVRQESTASRYKHVYCIVAYVFYYGINLDADILKNMSSFPLKSNYRSSDTTPIREFVGYLLLHYGRRL